MKNLLLAMRGKLLFGVATIVLAALFTGCGAGDNSYSQRTAKQHIAGWLQGKYPETFTITSIEKRAYGDGTSAGKDYYFYEAKSNDTGVSFEGTTSCSYDSANKDDYTVSDRYEEALYGEALCDEISSISHHLDQWGTLEFNIKADDARYKRSRSYDYNTFKADTEKVHIDINLYLDSDNSEAMLQELFNYTNRVYAINNDINLTIYKEKDVPLASLRTKYAPEFNYQYFVEHLS